METNLNKNCLTVLFCLLTFVIAVSSTDYKRGCYYTNWSQYRVSPYTFLPEDVDPFLCTHIFYAFAKLNSTALTVGPYEWNDEVLIGRLMKLKDSNSALKIYLVVGGWTAAGTDFSPIVSTDAKITSFARNVIPKLRRWGFDGFDIDWEYPGAGEQGSQPADKQRFTSLLRIMRSEFTQEAQSSGKPTLDLIIAASPSPWFGNRAYEFSQIHQYLDFINVMSYDLAGSWLPNVQHHSALKRATSFTSDWDMERSMDYWIGKGVPANKLMLGLATYARNFRISSNTAHAPGTRSIGSGDSGPITGTQGFLAYYEVCNFLKKNNWVSVWSNEQKVPYAYGRLSSSWNWAGYDSPRSFIEKVKYVKQRGLAGVFIWSLDFDDFKGVACGQGNYPLLTAVKQALADDDDTPASTPQVASATTSPTAASETASPTAASETASPTVQSATSQTAAPSPTPPTTSATIAAAASPTTTAGSDNFIPSCDVKGFGTNPNDCNIFYHCAHGHVYQKTCPMGLAFDVRVYACNWPFLVPGCNK